jgi:hypothetical protein
MARPSTPTRLTDEQLRDLLRLTKGSDSVELKLTVPASGQRSALRALGIDPLDAQVRQVFFFDTPDLTLYNAGLNLRARRIQGKGEDSVVKLRPVDPDRLDAEQRVSPNMKVEVDAMPGGYVCSASLKGKPATGDTRKVALAGLPIRRLFSKEQRNFFALHAPQGIEMDELAILGPIFVLKVTFTPDGFDRRMVAEMWFYPDGRRVLELSTKCTPDETMQVATETRLFLSDHDIDLTTAQETKTKSALQYFAKELRTASPADDGTDAAGESAEAAPGAVSDDVPVEVAAAAMDGEAEASAPDGAAPKPSASGSEADPD